MTTQNPSLPLLAYIDSLKGLFRIDGVSVIAEAMSKFHKRRDRDLVNKIQLIMFEISSDEANDHYFPVGQDCVRTLIEKLSYDKHPLGRRVQFLDILTCLVLLTMMPFEEKLKLLFEWYNHGQNGIMSEIEHVVFITRVGRCLNMMRAIGCIDLQHEDAEHMAFVARSRLEGDRYRFIPGLKLPDFQNWVLHSQETQPFLSFMRLLGRLNDMLTALDNRTNALLALMREKDEYKKHRINVPRPDLFPNQESHRGPTLVVFRDHMTVSLTLPISQPLPIDYIYVKCDKVVDVHRDRYILPKHIHDMKETNRQRQALPECCSKVCYFTSYHRCRPVLDQSKQSKPLLARIDVSDLDADETYILTAYTALWQYPPVQVTTRSHPRGPETATEQVTRSLRIPSADSCQ
jgi:hypothetical protein